MLGRTNPNNNNSNNMEFHKSIIGFNLPLSSIATGKGAASYQKNRDSLYSLKNIMRKSRLTEKYDVPRVVSVQFPDMCNRHPSDKMFIDKDYNSLTAKDYISIRYICDDSADISLTNASYSNFHIPLRIRCLDNYKQAALRYEEQFQKEIQNLVDNQPTALDACQFVRMMSYTTLWPPLHTKKELNAVSKNFFKLNESEKSRLKKIMTTDIT